MGVFALGLLALFVVVGVASGSAQESERAAGRADPRVGTAVDEATLAAAAQAAASSEVAARSMRDAIELDTARRVAPFDLEWGTP
jgi:hypothetical protein